MSGNQLRGIVSGILSGDSLIVRFVDAEIPIQVVILQQLAAPRFGRSDGKIYQDEPFGFDSWAFLREHCIGKRVTIPAPTHPLKTTRLHPAFGELPVIFSKVQLYEEKQDIGLLACKAGWVKIRNPDDLKMNPYIKELQEAQREAQEAKIGIWSETPGTVRTLPVPINVDNILQTRDFDAYVEGIKNVSVLSLFLIPNHENIHIRLNGIRPPNFNENEKLYKESTTWIRNNFLNRKIRVRLLTYQEPDQRGYPPNSYNPPTFFGCILDKFDGAIAHAISIGLAQYYPKTADSCPNPDNYIAAQLQAQKAHKGIWEKSEDPAPQKTEMVEGMITSIRGSNGLYLVVNGEPRVVYFNGITVPRYSTIVGCEPCGFEAREYLRRNYNKKFVSVVIEGQACDRVYATVSYKGQCLNAELCRQGLAEAAPPVAGVESHAAEEIRRATQDAKDHNRGKWAHVVPEAAVIRDLTATKNLNATFEELRRGARHKCIIEYITSTSRFTVLIPETRTLIRLALNGLVPLQNSDKIGAEAKMYLQQTILQTEAEFEVVSVDDHIGVYLFANMYEQSGQNIATKILELGYAEIITKLYRSESADIPQELRDAQGRAKASVRGVWADKTRHQLELVRGIAYEVQVQAVWDPCNLVVQFHGQPMKNITEHLARPLNKITTRPTKNDCLVLVTKGRQLRVRIESVNNEARTCGVKIIDFAQDHEASWDDLYELPAELKQVGPQARVVSLAWLRNIEKNTREAKNDNDFIWKNVNGAILYMYLVGEDNGTPSVVLLDSENIDKAGSLSTLLVEKGIARYVEDAVPPPEFKPVYQQLVDVMASAEKK